MKNYEYMYYFHLVTLANEKKYFYFIFSVLIQLIESEKKANGNIF